MTNPAPRRDDAPSLDPDVLTRVAAHLRGAMILPGDARYDSARLVWNRAVDRRPAAIVCCADVDDVRRTIDLARTARVRLAVRSGGHSQAGHATCDGGIVLDLGGLNAVHVDGSATVVRASAGARVAELLDAMQPHGMTTPTGGCPDVGLGGLTLGGGENLLMAKYGAVCDNVLSAQIVTADGDVVTASNSENSDLFWAIRGGGGNFGVVTSFDYRLYPVRRVLSGQLYFPLARTRDVLRRYRDLMLTAPDELQTSGGLMPSDDGPTLFVAFCHCGDSRSGEHLLAHWRATLRPERDNVEDKAYAAEFTMPSGPSTGTGAFLPELTDGVIEILAAQFADAPNPSMAVWNDYHGAVTRIPAADAAFPLRQRGFDLFVLAGWHAAAEQERGRQWVALMREGLRPFTHGVYVNNLEDEGEHRIREAYGPGYARLAAIKARYDPGNIFHANQNIRPAA
jgi:hypothetical protein